MSRFKEDYRAEAFGKGFFIIHEGIRCFVMTSGDACPTFRISTWDFYDLWPCRLFMG